MHFGKVKDSDQGSLTTKAFADRGQTAVVKFASVIDDEQARAERLYIVHVVGGNQDGHTSFEIDTQQKFANTRLSYNVQANRWFIQVEQLRIVQQRRREVATHALSQRKLADRSIDKFVEIQ